MIFYKYYAVIPRGTRLFFLKDNILKTLILIKKLNFSPKNKFLNLFILNKKFLVS
jgi:hypothetical protein